MTLPDDDFPRVTGVARDADNECTVVVTFSTPLTDDQIRAIHDAFKNGEAITDFDGELAFASSFTGR